MNSRGFTLIELLVVIAMMAILTSLGIASYASYNGSQVVQTAAADVANMLNTAKSQSISQVKPEDCGENSLSGYEVDIDSASQQYNLIALCPPPVDPDIDPFASPSADETATPSGNIDGKIIVVTKPLPPQISFDPASIQNVSFAISTGTVTQGGTITISGYGKTKTISVNDTGQITIN
jgi:prepilin-type N-terminal cleavage/methylation domain-containing protein